MKTLHTSKYISLFFLILLINLGVQSKAQFASSGLGYYKNQIFWMPWNAANIDQFNTIDGTITWTSADGLPQGVELTMTISAMNGVGNLYTSGTDGNDTFDDLFGGLTNNAVATADNSTLTRSINLSMTLNGQVISPQLVFADAGNSTTDEYIKVTRDGKAGWFLLEGWDRTTGNASDYTFNISGGHRHIATTQPAGTDIQSPVGTFALMAPNINSVDIELKGASTTAIALGILLPNDYSDALNYASANHLMQPVITSTLLPTGTYGGGSTDNDGIISPNSNPANYWLIATMKNDLYLGFNIDSDNTLTANKEATGDDLNGTDDEDAISGMEDIIINSVDDYTLTCFSYNLTGSNNYLYAWIDFNRDGIFSENEMINAGVPLSLGSTGIQISTLTWQLSDFSCEAGTIKAGPSYLRIRTTTQLLPNTIGDSDGRSIETAINGEAEDHLINILGFDNGDLPVSFEAASALVNTDSDNNGMPDAAGSIWIGNIVDDNECSSHFSEEADGDDTDGFSDEDGLTIPEELIAGRSADWTLTLNSQASVASVQWGIWFDWNGNGTFNDAGDGFYSGEADVAGLTPVVVSVLPPATAASKFGVRALIRPGAQGAFLQSDYAASIINGEVEDYVAEFPLKAYIIDQKNVPCYGGNNGEVTVEATGGTPPYLFSIDGINYSSNVLYTNLSAGNYTIYVKDNAGASVTVPVSITQTLEAVTATVASQTEVSCFGSSTGSATVTPAGGTPPYRFFFDGESTHGTSGIYTDLAAGSYPLVILDANDCQATMTITITQPEAALNATAAVTPIACYGSNTGALTITATGGTAPYSYSIDGGTTYQTSSTFSNLQPKTYSIKVKDVNDCTFDLTATITQPDELNASVTSVSEVDCFGTGTGSAKITATGGTAPYRYSIDNGLTENTTGEFTGLTAGNYNVLVKDANNCQTTLSLTISQPESALEATVSTQTNIDCFGAGDGSATVEATGGTAPYLFYFNGETVPHTSGELNGLSAGSYPVRVVDAKDCEVSLTITITSPEAALNATASVTNIDCYSSANGSFTVNATGGTAPYSYSIDGGTTYQSAPTFSDLQPNTYSIKVKDINNCTFDLAVTITEPEELKAEASTITEVNCFGSATGAAKITAIGGTSPYRFSLDNGVTENTTGEFTGLPAGNYPVLVKDVNNCQTTLSLTISQPEAALEATVSTQSNIDCFGADDGTASISVTGGTEPYRFYFNGETLPRTSGIFSGLSAGSYPVRVVDAKDCEVSLTITITSPEAALNATASVTNIDCYSSANGSFTITATGGTAPYSYSIDGGSTYQTEPTFSNLAANVYAVHIKDSKNCTTDLNVTLYQPDELVATVSTKTDVSCFESSTGSSTVTATGGTSPYQFSLDNGQNFNTTGTFANLPAGNYTVLVKDQANCQTTVSFTISQPESVLKASVTFKTDVDCINQTGAFTILASGGTEPYTYSLNGGTPQSSGSYSNLTVGQYVVTVLDSRGCSTDQTISIQDLTEMNPTLSTDFQTICKNNPVTFTATGGNEYEFLINGTLSRARSSVATFVSSSLSDGDAVTVNVYNTLTGCEATAGPVVITVHPIPEVTLAGYSDVCTVVPSFALSGGLPEGGV